MGQDDSTGKRLESEERRWVTLTLIGILIFIGCLVLSQAILPENCLIYEYRQVGLLCDGFEINNPKPCPVCSNESGASVARYVLLFGCVMFFVAPVVSIIRRRRSQGTKLLTIAGRGE
jgi:hypothetical protein